MLIAGITFTCLLLTSNIIAVKLISVGGWTVPAAVICYPFTFLITDIISEIYGRSKAIKMIWYAFGANILMLILIYTGKVIPSTEFWQGQEAYNAILGAMPRVVGASLFAYIISQHHDIFTFSFIRRLTNGKLLWLRNNGSTFISQGIDTILFITIAFYSNVPNNILIEMLWMQYLIKIGIALIDTPFCYLFVTLYSNKGIKGG